MYGGYCRAVLCKDNFIFVWDMKHSLSCFWNRAFNWVYRMKSDALIDNFSIIPKYVFYIDDLPMIWKNDDILAIDSFFLAISPTPLVEAHMEHQISSVVAGPFNIELTIIVLGTRHGDLKFWTEYACFTFFIFSLLKGLKYNNNVCLVGVDHRDWLAPTK